MLNTLSVSQTGLNTAKHAVENVSNNLANENTPGYKKRVVQISESEHLGIRFTGEGVSAESAYRITSQYLYDKMMTENSKLDYHNKTAEISSSVEKLFKETDTSGLSKEMNRYFKAVEDLRADPHSTVAKNTLKSQGTLLVKSMQNIYKGLDEYQNLLRNDLSSNLTKANKYINQIADINYKLKTRSAISQNDLLDKRDTLENKLSKLVDTKVVRHENSYELFVGKERVVYNTLSNEMDISREKKLQVNNYITLSETKKGQEGIKSNIDFGAGFDTDDVIKYKLNNEYEVSVKFGDKIEYLDKDGNKQTITAGADNYIRALVAKINTDKNMSQFVEASNGYKNHENSLSNVDKFLSVTSKIEGIEGSFNAYIAIEKRNGTNVESRNTFYENKKQSTPALDTVKLKIYNAEIKLDKGEMKAQMENLQSDSLMNKIQKYKDNLDKLAMTLSDVTRTYVELDKGKYVYGEASVDARPIDTEKRVNLYGSTVDKNHKFGLFSGSSVMKLEFHQNAVNDLKQDNLEYLATLQWKTDVSFSHKGQNGKDENITSFMEYYEEVRYTVSSDKADNDFLLKTQKVVTRSIESSHDQLTKVDKDEQMIDLIKFQSAYTSNAKVITTIDEMLKTLLGLKR